MISSMRLMNSGLKNVVRVALQVRGHDQHDVGEVHRAALPVGQPAVVEHLQQHAEHVRVRLLDLVEQHHRVRPAAHELGELAALVVADVPRGRADQAGDGVLLLVLAHVDADHGPHVVEQEVGQRPGQLGLAHAGRPEEQERPDRPVRVGQPARDRRMAFDTAIDRLVLADDPLVEDLLHPQQLGHLAFHEPWRRAHPSTC